MSDSSPHSRLDEIGRTLRHAQATRKTPTDSWLNGYQEDVAYLLEQYEHTKETLRMLDGNFAEERRGLLEQLEATLEERVELERQASRLEEQLEAARRFPEWCRFIINQQTPESAVESIERYLTEPGYADGKCVEDKYPNWPSEQDWVDGDSSSHSRLDEIGRTLRHAQATRKTPTDSWLNGYQEDVAYLVEQYEVLARQKQAALLDVMTAEGERDRILEQLEATLEERVELERQASRLEEQYEHLKETLRMVEGNFAEERRGLLEQYETLRSAARAVMDAWVREFAEYGHPEDGDVPKWQTYPYSKLRDALASNPASGVAHEKVGGRATGRSAEDPATPEHSPASEPKDSR